MGTAKRGMGKRIRGDLDTREGWFDSCSENIRSELEATMTIRNAIPITAVVLTLAASSACKSHGPTTTEDEGSRPISPIVTQPEAVGASPDDELFMTEAAKANLFEVALGWEAQANGGSQQVKAFGKRMVEDHEKANTELTQLAQTMGATLPTAIDQDHRDELQRLAQLSGREFDEAYAKLMVEEHERAVKRFHEEAKRADDPKLRTWATRTAYTLEAHLRLAEEMKSKSLKRPAI